MQELGNFIKNIMSEEGKRKKKMQCHSKKKL